MMYKAFTKKEEDNLIATWQDLRDYYIEQAGGVYPLTEDVFEPVFNQLTKDFVKGSKTDFWIDCRLLTYYLSYREADSRDTVNYFKKRLNTNWAVINESIQTDAQGKRKYGLWAMKVKGYDNHPLTIIPDMVLTNPPKKPESKLNGKAKVRRKA